MKIHSPSNRNNNSLSKACGVEESTQRKGNKDKGGDEEEEHNAITLLTNTQSVP